MWNFNPRSHKGNDSSPLPILTAYFHFNPRSHKGNDLCYQIPKISIKIFQSTFPQGERHLCQKVHTIKCDFNPRSHKGNDSRDTEKCWYGRYFNPRSHKGNDVASKFNSIPLIYFNPRSHKGNDSVVNSFFSIFFISIHVPTRGTTM